MAGLGIIEQSSWAAGMFRGVRPERQPVAAAFDVLNGLVSDDGAIFRRGGSSYRSSSAFGSGLTFVWDGLLTGGQRTVIGHPTGFATVSSTGGVVGIGGAGLDSPGRAAVMNGTLFLPGGTTYDGTGIGAANKAGDYYAAVADRLFVGTGDRIDFTTIGTVGTFQLGDFHRLPEGVSILGMEPLRDSLAVFTTGGVWIISNLSFNLTDAEGNVQHTLDQYSRDLVLWGDAGIAGWGGALVVPGVDGVWLMSRGVASEAPVPLRKISLPIERLYQDYVHRGYRPGQAAVYRGHYFLPVLRPDNTFMDLLVCRLDLEGTPWTRLGGFGGTITALTVPTPVGTSRDPHLIGTHPAGRLLTLEYLDPSEDSIEDADGSAWRWHVETRDFQTGAMDTNTVMFLDASYELTDPGAEDPTIRAERISGRVVAGQSEWGLFSWGEADWGAASPGVGLSGEAPEDPFGQKTYRWPVRSRERFIRFRLVCDDKASRLVLRRLRVHVRASGR